MKAVWNGCTIAESDETIVVESNHYFPIESVNKDYLTSSETTSYCPWKGTAQYFTLQVSDETNKDAAWYYAAPKDKAKHIAGMVAFWKGVEVIDR
jgi:uncharacterized protein (DUF427 family)